jgi:hypothetical protein
MPDVIGFLRASLQGMPTVNATLSPWTGTVPAPMVLSWMKDIETLARPDDEALLACLSHMRASLAPRLMQPTK